MNLSLGFTSFRPRYRPKHDGLQSGIFLGCQGSETQAKKFCRVAKWHWSSPMVVVGWNVTQQATSPRLPHPCLQKFNKIPNTHILIIFLTLLLLTNIWGRISCPRLQVRNWSTSAVAYPLREQRQVGITHCQLGKAQSPA